MFKGLKRAQFEYIMIFVFTKSTLSRCESSVHHPRGDPGESVFRIPSVSLKGD